MTNFYYLLLLCYLQCLKQMFPWMCIVEDKKPAARNDTQTVISEKIESVAVQNESA